MKSCRAPDNRRALPPSTTELQAPLLTWSIWQQMQRGNHRHRIQLPLSKISQMLGKIALEWEALRKTTHHRGVSSELSF